MCGPSSRRRTQVFTIKKLLLCIITIPGALIALMFAGGILAVRKRRYGGALLMASAAALYILSIGPVADFAIGRIELLNHAAAHDNADSIILLGGGLVEGAADLTGEHIPSPVMMVRIVECVRLHRRHGLPIVVSGGVVGSGPAEAPVYRRFLVDLGVPPERIIVESRSRDTVENARYVRPIIAERGFRTSILLTSAFHLRRATLIFREEGLSVVPHSCGQLARSKKKLDTYDALPTMHNLYKSSLALREFAGLALYRIKYAVAPSSSTRTTIVSIRRDQ